MACKEFAGTYPLAKQGVPEQGVNIDQSRQDRDFSCRATIPLRLTAFDCSRMQLPATGFSWLQVAASSSAPSKFSSASNFKPI